MKENTVSVLSIILTSLLLQSTIIAESERSHRFKWPNSTLGAVTLSYDDALTSHFESVAPQLTKAGLSGTFYITVDTDGFRDHIEAWHKVAAAGHELGNHTLYHPCRKDKPNQHTWLSDDYNLSKYTPNRWRREMRVANLALQLVDGKLERTFGNTCCNNTIGPIDNPTSLAEIIPELFVAARGEFIHKPIDPENANLPALGHFGADGRSFDEIRNEIESAITQGKWAFYMLHGVGKGTHSLYIKTEEHTKLINYLAANRDRIWTAPAIDVAKFVKQQGTK